MFMYLSEKFYWKPSIFFTHPQLMQLSCTVWGGKYFFSVFEYHFYIKEGKNILPHTLLLHTSRSILGTRLTIGEPTNSKHNIREFAVAIGWLTYRSRGTQQNSSIQSLLQFLCKIAFFYNKLLIVTKKF